MGVAEPTQIIINGGNSTVDILQDSVSTVFSDSTFEGINDLIGITLNTDSNLANNSVDNILNAITGSSSSTITTVTAVTETTSSTISSLTEIVSPHNSVTNLTDNLFHSLRLF